MSEKKLIKETETFCYSVLEGDINKIIYCLQSLIREKKGTNHRIDIDIDYGDAYNEANFSVRMTYEIEETATEMRRRIKREEKKELEAKIKKAEDKVKREEKEKKQLERLKKKYEK